MLVRSLCEISDQMISRKSLVSITASSTVLRSIAAVALLLAVVAFPVAAPAQTRAPRAVLAFVPAGGQDNPSPVIDRLAARPQLALGLVSATQGRYTPEQTLLDLTAGSRTSASVYEPRTPPHVELVVGGDDSGFIFGWSNVLTRAKTALAEIKPGLLASRIAQGGAYVGVKGRTNVEAVAAADSAGDIRAVSLGPATSLAARVDRLLANHRFVVAGLPTAAKGDAVLDTLLRDRRPGDLLVVMQSPPRSRVPLLLPIGVAGAGSNGALTSATTQLNGIVAGIDIPVTILHRLGLGLPRAMRGQAIRTQGVRDVAALTALDARLRVISGRRTPTLGGLLLGWLALVLALGVLADRRGVRAGMRIGALALLWLPAVLLFTAWLAPSRLAEIAIVVVTTLGLGALTDRFVRWPRGPLVPAAACILAYSTDLIFGSPLIIRSLLGSSPRSGARFHGIGNELEATLTVLLLVGLGALLCGRVRSRPNATSVALSGIVFAVIVGAAQLGADVGGVLTIGAGTAAATVLMLPGTPSRRTLLLSTLAPVAALIALAVLDLATGGNGHFTNTILHADSSDALWDVFKRRYTLAFNTLSLGAMPLITLIALLAAAYAVRHRDRIYAPVHGMPSWRAALIGGLTASIAGALFNDSGPILLVIGVVVLTCTTTYIRGDPRLAADPLASAPNVTKQSLADRPPATEGEQDTDALHSARPPNPR